MLNWTIDQCLEKHQSITIGMNEIKQEADMILKKVISNPELAHAYKNRMDELAIEMRSLAAISIALTNYVEKQLDA